MLRLAIRPILLLFIIGLGLGCTSAYKRLPSLDQVPELARLSDQTAQRQIRHWSLPVGEVDGAPYHMVADELGEPRDDQLVVLVHGMVSDRTTWQFVAGTLGQTHRLFLPDMIGNGESDHPDPRKLQADAYSPTGAARHLLEALSARHREQPLPERIVFVGHSLGGGVVLRLLSAPELQREYPEILSRCDRAVLISPLEFAVHRATEALAELTRVGSFRVALGRATGIIRNEAAKELLASAERPEWVFKFDVDRLYDAFKTKARRLPTQAIIRTAAPFDEETARPDWDAIETLVGDYQNVQIPVLLIWGDRDETLPLSMGYKLLAELPDARLRIVRRGKHSLQADRPTFLADWLRRFIDDENAAADWEKIVTIGD